MLLWGCLRFMRLQAFCGHTIPILIGELLHQVIAFVKDESNNLSIMAITL